MADATAKVRVENLYKIFGEAPEDALRRLEAGASKEAIHRETGSVVAVADVSFAVAEGESFVVMGLSGSGKSTLIRCINRLFEPTSGRVHIGEQDVVGLDPEGLRRLRLGRIAMVFQHFALFPHKTVLDNAAYGLKVRGVAADERREKALDALDQVGLKAWAEAYPHNLSGGMQQRVGLARALAVDPEILLMDEPFSALDPLIRREMQDELIELQRKLGMTIIFITHDLHEALKLGDRVAIMKDGAFVQVGVPEEIVGGPADQYVTAFTQDVDRGRVFTVGTVMKRMDMLVEGHDTVRTAAYRMREQREAALYVTDRRSRPVGVVLDEDVGRAMREGVRDLKAVMRTDFPQANEETPLADVYDQCTSGMPIAIVDERGRIRGVVYPLDVFAELSPSDAGEAATDAPGDAPETAPAP